MARPRKTNPTKGGVSFLEKDRYTAELTSGQLVFGISILLVFGLTCFLLGILVGRFEPAQLQQVAAAPTDEMATPARTDADATPERSQLARKSVSVESPAQSSPAQSTPAQPGVREDKPRRATVATPAPVSAEKGDDSVGEERAVSTATSTPSEGPKDLSGPRRVEFPEPEPSISKSETTAKGEDTAPPSEPVKPEPATATTPATPEAESPRAIIIESPLDKPIGDSSETEPRGAETPNAEPMQVAAAPTKPMEPVEPAETAAPAVRTPGAFSIQVAAMSKESNAEALQKRFDAELPYGARIERVPSRGLSIVLVGGFASRDAAQSALRDFKAKYPNFADAFVRAEK